MTDNEWPKVLNHQVKELVLMELGPKHVIGSRASGGAGIKISVSSPQERRKAGISKIPPINPELALGARHYHKLAKLSDTEILNRIESYRTKARQKKIPHVKARFDYWARMDSWSIQEALYLSFGIDPELLKKPISRSAFEHWEENALKPDPLYLSLTDLLCNEGLEQYKQAYSLAARKYGENVISMRQLPIPDFMAWAETKSIPICSELLTAVEKTMSKMESQDLNAEKIAELEATIFSLQHENESLLAEIAEYEALGKDANPKSRNTFLRYINALVSGLIDGRTGRPSTDAEIAMTTLATREVTHELKTATLREYLSTYDKEIAD